MKIIPSKGYALIREEKLPETSKAGIHLMDAARKTGVFGEIVAVTNEGSWIQHLFGGGTKYRKRQKIIYSPYMTQETFCLDEQGNQMKDVWFIPVHGIFATRA